MTFIILQIKIKLVFKFKILKLTFLQHFENCIKLQQKIKIMIKVPSKNYSVVYAWVNAKLGRLTMHTSMLKSYSM